MVGSSSTMMVVGVVVVVGEEGAVVVVGGGHSEVGDHWWKVLILEVQYRVLSLMCRLLQFPAWCASGGTVGLHTVRLCAKS